MAARTFRFRPRYRGLALVSAGVGGSLVVVAAALHFLTMPLVTGTIGIVLASGYLLSPAWGLRVTIDDDGLEVGTAKVRRFRLAWGDVARVIASAATETCFVDGGAPDRSLLVPGDGAPAPYDLEGRAEIYALVLAHVPADRVTQVETLEAYQRAQKQATKPAKAP